MSRFSNKTYVQDVTARLQPELTCPIDRPEAWSAWRHALREKVAELLGGLPPAQGEPPAEVLDRRVEDGYVREKIAVCSREGVEVPAYLLTPMGTTANGGKRRAVLCLHGHGNGKNDVVGDPGDGTPEQQAANAAHIVAHNYDYARRFAQMGFVVLAPEARGFGERAEAACAPPESPAFCFSYRDEALTLDHTNLADNIRWEGAAHDAHAGEALIRAGPPEPLAEHTLATCRRAHP